MNGCPAGVVPWHLALSQADLDRRLEGSPISRARLGEKPALRLMRCAGVQGRYSGSGRCRRRTHGRTTWRWRCRTPPSLTLWCRGPKQRWTGPRRPHLPRIARRCPTSLPVHVAWFARKHSPCCHPSTDRKQGACEQRAIYMGADSSSQRSCYLIPRCSVVLETRTAKNVPQIITVHGLPAGA